MRTIPLRRSTAFLIDTLVVNSIVTFSIQLFPMAFKIIDFEFLGLRFILGIRLVFVVYLFYFIVFDLLKNGQTIGKQLLNLTVVAKDNKLPDLKKRVLRSLYKTLGIMVLPVSIILFLTRNYTFQEYYSGTITINNNLYSR
ncbi:MAG: RDD family protein [Bacteroidota bacterium]